MTALSNRRILLGISGGIAAYKSAEIVRRLQDEGAVVRVAMTQGAKEFITPLTFQALSRHPVYDDSSTSQFDGMEHISLARWADAVLIAPASANMIAKLGLGLADNFLSTLCLASERPLFVAPAMNRTMWAHPATQSHVQTLSELRVTLIGPGTGSQACGETGEGRMEEPAAIVATLAQAFTKYGPLQGLNVLVTAGPTREPIDPVRFVSNHSSGKMGYAIASAANAAGANVTLITGPTSLEIPAGIKCVKVETAAEMHNSVLACQDELDIFIANAAVTDYRPKSSTPEKIKKKQDEMRLEMVRNPDILAAVSNVNPKVFTVGFAAETHDLRSYARDKLKHKKLDMIAANWVGEVARKEGTGFNGDNNALLVLTKNTEHMLTKDSKENLARQLIDLIATEYHAKHTT